MNNTERIIRVLEGIEKQLRILNMRLSTKHNNKYHSITDLLLFAILEYVGDPNIMKQEKEIIEEEEAINNILNTTPSYKREETNNSNKERIVKKI